MFVNNSYKSASRFESVTIFTIKTGLNLMVLGLVV